MRSGALLLIRHDPEPGSRLRDRLAAAHEAGLDTKDLELELFTEGFKTGMTIKDRCASCEGQGVVQKPRKVNVTFPAPSAVRWLINWPAALRSVSCATRSPLVRASVIVIGERTAEVYENTSTSVVVSMDPVSDACP